MDHRHEPTDANPKHFRPRQHSKKISAQHRSTIDELEQTLEKDQLGFGIVASTMEGQQVVDRESRLVLLGKPGGAKTTFLKWIALTAMDGTLKEQRLPVFVPMKDWSDGKNTIRAYIHEEFKVCGFEEPATFVDGLLESGSLIGVERAVVSPAAI